MIFLVYGDFEFFGLAITVIALISVSIAQMKTSLSLHKLSRNRKPRVIVLLFGSSSSLEPEQRPSNLSSLENVCNKTKKNIFLLSVFVCQELSRSNNRREWLLVEKKKSTLSNSCSCNASVLLLTMNFVITLSK